MTGRAGTPNESLADIRARAERRRTRTRDEMWHELVLDAWRRSQAATTPEDRLRWLARANRLLPSDGMVALAYASALMEGGEPARAAGLFAGLAARHGLHDAWAGLAVCCRQLGNGAGALAATESLLRSHVPTPVAMELAALVAAEAARPGWCGLTLDGELRVQAAKRPSVWLDETAIRPRWTATGAQLPEGWRQASQIHSRLDGRDLLGSPLPVAVITRLEGVVTAEADGLAGWAWHPADPGRDPVLTIETAGQAVTVVAAEAADVQLDRPFARPRRFAWPANAPATVRGPDGRDLLGSPCDPGLERRTAASVLRHLPSPAPPLWADLARPTPAARPRRAAVDVVIPVYRGLHHTMACLDAVLATVPRTTGIVVVEDASPEPALVAALQAAAATGRIRLIRQARNLGFPGTVNAGLRACAGRDVVVLNSDTLVPPGWLGRLRAAAYAAPDIGTVTPLSNDATILSYPALDGGNPVPDLAETQAVDALAQAVNGAGVTDIPTGVGFCLYVRRDCLDQVGPLREDCFAQGYGEENDFCLRAWHLGWRSVAAPGVFVAHVGGQSFGGARQHLMRRNIAGLNRLHPGYDDRIAAYLADDSLTAVRRRMDAARWEAARDGRPAVVIVTHAGGGGVDRVVAMREAQLAGEGRRAIVLRPAPGGCAVADTAFPNLRYAVPRELPLLAALLSGNRPEHVELHHRLGHQPEITGLAAALGIPVEVYVHDYAWFCQRIALVGTEGRYCGEPDIQGCIDCIADLGTMLTEEISVPALVQRSAADLGLARRVTAPSNDAAARIARHFPGVSPVVTAWEDDAAWPALAPMPLQAIRRICVVGAIGREKGYDVLLGCVRDARDRSLPIEFVVVGYTADDVRLLDAGPVQITGEYRDDEAVALIEAQGSALAFIPSIWPETWCYALSRAWEAGLAAAAFDLGAPAERIRATGRGWLLPLGLRPAAVNDALLRLAPLAPVRGARHRERTN